MDEQTQKISSFFFVAAATRRLFKKAFNSLRDMPLEKKIRVILRSGLACFAFFALLSSYVRTTRAVVEHMPAEQNS